MNDAQGAHAVRVAAKEDELASARAAMTANSERFAGTSRLRGKQHKIRGDAQLRRAAQLGDTIQRLERELAALGRGTTSAPLDLADLPDARFVRTRSGWHEVVKVNRRTVKVLAAPGMDDLIPITRIIEIRRQEEQ